MWICLRDFVGDNRLFCSSGQLNHANSRFALLYGNSVKPDWLRGVAGSQPRLGFRFWGVSSKEKGGLHQPPFALLGCDCSVVSWFATPVGGSCPDRVGRKAP